MNKKIITSKEQLLNFLCENVWVKNLAIEEKLNVSLSVKTRLIEGTKKSMERANNCKSSEEIALFFFNALVSEPGKNHHENIKRYNLISFEDVREEFEKLCYGEDV